MKKRIVSKLTSGLLYVLITFALVEGVLWIMGYRPYYNTDYEVISSPQNPYVAHETLGIQLNVGSYAFTLNKGVKFSATHLDNGQRLIPGANSERKDNILFLGCSYTYGYGVNDSESYPALIQSKQPQWNIENTAVVGYGTAQHLLQLRNRLQSGETPQCVVLGLSSVHFIRTVLSEQYRANLRIGYRRSSSNIDDRMDGANFPFFDDCSGKVKQASWKDLYAELPGRYWSATINFIQGILERSRETQCDPIEITACIILEMHTLCQEKEIPFGVICLDTSHETKELKKQLKGVPWKNIGFSFKKKKYTHLPYDSHPNAAGHKKIAGSVLPFIEKLLHE